MTATLETDALEPIDDSSAAEAGERAAANPTVPASLQPWHDPHPRVGWLLAMLTVAIASVTRFWAVGFPPTKQFDEVYYATEAQELLRFGYEDNRDYTFIVHPPLGKWAIALTSALFGNDSTGWRIAPAIAGIVSVLIITRVARRMFHSNVFGAIAGLLLALDGVSLVQSRVALLDIFLQTFILAGFAALVIDRDQMRARLATLVGGGVDLGDGAPTLGPRPWRVVAGAMLGMACAVKWSALSFWIVFMIMSLVWDRGALKSAGVRRSWRNAMRRSWLGAIGSLVGVTVTVYLLCWLGWFAGENSWNRHWADSHRSAARLDLLGVRIPFNWGWVPSGIRSLGDYTFNAYRFHESLDSYHPYKSNPWSWLVLGRPVTYYYPSNVTGCGSQNCVRETLLIGTPLMWWAFVPALIWLTWHWFTTRDWRASIVWIAMAGGWLVWFQDPKRTMFLFYMTPLVPYLILGVVLAMGVMLGPGIKAVAAGGDVDGRFVSTVRAGRAIVHTVAWRRRRIAIIAICVYLSLVIVDFVWMWPLFTGGLITYSQWYSHMWFASWV
jgi:dolichyl-phosphate-mannose--protein O-mannosyl transferase